MSDERKQILQGCYRVSMRTTFTTLIIIAVLELVMLTYSIVDARLYGPYLV